MTSVVSGIEPVEIESARGAVVHAANGREYVDRFAGIAVVNAGHVHPKVADAAKRQCDRFIHGCSHVCYVPTVADLAETLARITPGALRKTFFANSGAEAIEGDSLRPSTATIFVKEPAMPPAARRTMKMARPRSAEEARQ